MNNYNMVTIKAPPSVLQGHRYKILTFPGHGHCKIQTPLRVWVNDDSDYEWILSMILSLDYIKLDEFTVSKGDWSVVAW